MKVQGGQVSSQTLTLWSDVASYLYLNEEIYHQFVENHNEIAINAHNKLILCHAQEKI